MIQVVLITRTGKAYLANGIAAFTLDKEAYTPYSQLTATVYGNFSIQQFAGIYRVQLLLDGTELHFGTVEKFRLVQENGTSYVRFSSRGLTALLLQNQLEPGLHTAMSLDKLMQDFVTFPKEITWESDTDTSNYLFVKEGTSMWDGVANLTYKLCGRYPFVYHANEIRMHLPETYRNFYVGADTLLGMGMTADQSRIYSRFSMADADGTYGKFQENDPNAAALDWCGQNSCRWIGSISTTRSRLWCFGGNLPDGDWFPTISTASEQWQQIWATGSPAPALLKTLPLPISA